MDYMIHVIARLEHEERIRSLQRVAEYDLPLKVNQPNRILRLANRLIYGLGSNLVSLGERLQPRHDLPATASVTK